MKLLTSWMARNSNSKHCLFSFSDLRSLLPELSNLSLKTLLSRAVQAGYFIKVCRGIYLYSQTEMDGLILFRTAALLRANEFNYISLETVLSDAGVISQMPINRITIMTSGRSNIINCNKFGAIEFIHTTQKPEQLIDQLYYDGDCGLWRASVSLALRDMLVTRRNLDLIDRDNIDELI